MEFGAIVELGKLSLDSGRVYLGNTYYMDIELATSSFIPSTFSENTKENIVVQSSELQWS